MIKPFIGNFDITMKFNEKASWFASGVHNGVDWAMPKNTPLIACFNAVVVEVARYNLTGYGRYIRIKSLNGRYIALYGHLSNITVQPGDKIKKGSIIGYSGNSGYVISFGGGGYHLHFSLWKDSVLVDPLQYIDELNNSLLTASDNAKLSTVAPVDAGKTIHIVQPGETLSAIALKHYGAGNLWPVIFSKNQKVIGDSPNKIRAGLKLIIP